MAVNHVTRIVAAGSCWKTDRAGARMLDEAGCTLVQVDDRAALLSLLSGSDPGFDIILYDGDLDGGTADFLHRYPHVPGNWPLVYITSRASIGIAVDVMRSGAAHFLAKPVQPKRLLAVIADATQQRRTVEPARNAVPTVPDGPADSIPSGFMGFIGCSPPMLAIYDKIKRLGQSPATVFITGESGTGKEVCAEAIHASGKRSKAPFIAINCGAIPENLLESELFGHVKGSFSGAASNRHGAAMAADGGTLFLDEICEMPLNLQVKLLRFLQSGTVQRVGETRATKVDVRILCATNRHPETEVAEGRFRSDLYFRLNVVRLEMPPLRARGDDISLLASRFLDQFSREEGTVPEALTRDAIVALGRRSWPGNVRELQNRVRSAVALGDMRILTDTAECPDNVRILPVAPALRPVETAPPPGADAPDIWDSLSYAEMERRIIEQAIARSGGNLSVAARRLQVSPSTLYRKKERWSQRGMLHAC